MKPRTTWRAITAVSVLWPMLAACSQATFGGEGDRAGASGDSSPEASGPRSVEDPGQPPGRESGGEDPVPGDPPAPAELSLTCDAWEGRATDLEADAGVTQTKIKGEICERNDTTVSILLLVDTSTSMRESDPEAGGGCGRLRAAQALADKLKAAGNADVRVQTFADRAKAGTLDAASLCAASGQTNYAAALDAAEEVLRSMGGERRGLYLISDGLPDVFSQRDPMAAGLEAARRLEAAVPELKFNALYFGKVKDGQDPKAYLERLVADLGEVRVVDQAAELAEAIVQVAAPAALDRATFRLDVTWDGGPKLTAKAESLTPVAGRPGRVEFVTEAVDLSARTGGETLKISWRGE